MKSTIDKLDNLSRKITVEIPQEKVQKAFEKVYKGLQKKANIKGFRQGKAPLATIKSVYGDQVKGDVINELINDAYQIALDEHSLEPVGYPKVSFEPIDEAKAFTFSAEVEIRPEVEIKKFEGLDVLKEKIEITEDKVSDILNNIRTNQAELVTVFEDRPLTIGDVAIINFEGSVNGQPLPNGSATDHNLEIGAKQFIEGFEDGLVGMKIGESRVLNLRFPEGYHEASLSGAPVDFNVKLTGIKKKVLPEINDEMATKMGEFKSLDDLKARIRQDIEDSEGRRVQDDLRSRVIKALVEANPVDAPKSLVAQQRHALEEDFKNRLKQQGMNDNEFEEYRQKWGHDFEESASFMVKSTFLLDALADKLGLRAKPSEIEDKINEYAQQTGIEIARLKEFYGQPERRSRLSFQVTEEKVVKHLIDKANIKEVTKDQLQ